MNLKKLNFKNIGVQKGRKLGFSKLNYEKSDLSTNQTFKTLFFKNWSWYSHIDIEATSLGNIILFQQRIRKTSQMNVFCYHTLGIN